MFWSSSLLLVLSAILSINDVAATPLQTPLQIVPNSELVEPTLTQHNILIDLKEPRKLHGRFLHITDMHPDPYYTPQTSESASCHRKKPKKKKDGAKYYGTPYSECDSPFRLTNFTLDYLKENWANEIDFVVWTGDNARHDNDHKLPRTPSEINDLNRAVADKMRSTFSSKGIPVIPSLGNNDIWPHNILAPGPNSITNDFASIWSSFIPFPYLQVFQRGAYYAVEPIPDELAVISLNTMYFYDSNKVVSGCPYTDPNDSGNLEIDWLEVQLEMYRKRGMQVWISGHVPPSSGNYFPECYVRYVELALRFQDTILGHLFGHMNVDHFFFLEAVDLEIFPEKQSARINQNDEDGLFQTLIDEFSTLPKNPKLADYAVVNVAPSVVPNPYSPAFRIFTYNVTDDMGGDSSLGAAPKPKKPKKPSKRKHGHPRGDHGNKTVHCETEEYQNTWRCHLDEPWNSDANSPSRKNQRWTPLGYAQYYIPKLEKANETHAPQFELEYLTYPIELLHPKKEENNEGEFVYPVPLKLLPEPLREPDVAKSKYAPYGMEDLTIPSWIRLGREVAADKRAKLRKRFRKYMFVGGKEEE